MQDAQDKGSKAPYLKNTLVFALRLSAENENYIHDSNENVSRDLRQLKSLRFPDVYCGRYEKHLYLLAKCGLRFFQKVKLY